MPKSCSLLHARCQVILQIRKMTHMQGSDKHCEAMPLNIVYHRIHCVIFLMELRWPKSKSLYYPANSFCQKPTHFKM